MLNIWLDLARNRRDGGGWQHVARSREAGKSLVDMKRYRRLGNRQQGRPWRVTAYSWRSVSTTTCCLYMERFIARNRSLKGTARRQRLLVRMSLIQALFRSSWFSSASEMRVWSLLWLRSLGMANDINTSRVPLPTQTGPSTPGWLLRFRPSYLLPLSSWTFLCNTFTLAHVCAMVHPQHHPFHVWPSSLFQSIPPGLTSKVYNTSLILNGHAVLHRTSICGKRFPFRGVCNAIHNLYDNVAFYSPHYVRIREGCCG